MTTTISGTDGVSAHATGSVVQQDIGANVVGTGPVFSVHRNDVTVGSLVSDSTIPYTTKLFDTNNNFNTGTYRFTAAIAGYYSFTACCYFTDISTTPIHLVFKKNGVSVAVGNYAYPAYSNQALCEINALVYCNVNDYITVHSYGPTATLHG